MIVTAWQVRDQPRKAAVGPDRNDTERLVRPYNCAPSRPVPPSCDGSARPAGWSGVFWTRSDLHFKGAFALNFAGFVFIFALAQSYLLLDRGADQNDHVASILLSGLLCLVVAAQPLATPGLLAAPRLLALLVFAFFPLFALFYLYFPELGKWYLQYFPSIGFSRTVAIATAATVAALPLFLIGYLLGERSLRPLDNPPSRPFTPTRTGVFLLLLAAAAGFAGMVFYARSLGGIAAVMSQMDSMVNRRIWREVANESYYLGMFLMTVPAILALLPIYRKRSLSLIVAAGALLLLSAGFLVVTQASREKAIYPIIQFIFTLLVLARGQSLASRRWLPKTLVIGAALLLVGTFSVQTFFRGGGADAGVGILNGLRDFNRIDVSMVMFYDFLNPASGNSLLLGVPIFDYPNQFLVRLFDFDPISNTSEILQQFIFSGDPNAGNPGAPLAGELYVNFGIFGYLAFPLCGFLFGRSHARLKASDYAFWPAVFYGAALYFFIFKLFIYTGLSESVLMMLLVFLPLWLWKTLLRVKL